MTTATALVPSSPLTVTQFQHLAEVPPEIEWFANLTNANTRRAYQQDIESFMVFAGLRQPAQFRDVTRAHVIAWREQLVGQGLANDTIRRKLAALSSLYAYLCDRNAVLHNPVLGYVQDTCKKMPQQPHVVVAKSRWGCNGSGCTVISSIYCPNRLRCSVR